MNWFQQNRFLGTFLAVFGLATIVALWFLFSARSSWHEARARFDQTAMELNRLQRMTPFPNEPNLVKMRAQAEDYSARLDKLKEELRGRTLPAVPMEPSQFQEKLRQTVAAVSEKARANRVTLPENFYLGFEEFATALPEKGRAEALGQQLAQAELLVGMLIDARVEAITSLRRVPEPAATPTPAPGARRPPNTPPAAAPVMERTAMELTFLSAPAAARRAINQISTANQQFYILRTLHVLNERDQGPPRDPTAAAAEEPPPAAAGKPAPDTPAAAALTFIVGNERVQTTARVEMVRFTF